MAKNPTERFQNYAEFRIALEAARSQVLIAQFTGQPSPLAGIVREGKSWWRR